jgi:hypothetical protein
VAWFGALCTFVVLGFGCAELGKDFTTGFKECFQTIYV